MTDRGGPRWPVAALGLLPLLVVLVTITAPILIPLRAALADLTPGTFAIGAHFDDPILRSAFVNTVSITLAACTLATIAAFALTAAVTRSVRRPTIVALLLMALPFVVPPFVTAAMVGPHLKLLTAPLIEALPAMLSWLDEPGGRLILVYALHYFPLLTGTLLFRLDGFDRDQADAARTLGAGRWTVWRGIVAPLALPGLVLGACLMALRIIGDAATPILLGEQVMLAPLLLDRLDAAAILPTAAASVLMTALGLAVVVLGWNSLRMAGGTPGRPASDLRRINLATRGVTRLLLLPLLIVGFVVTLLPLAALLAEAVSVLILPGHARALAGANLPVKPMLPNLQSTLLAAAAGGIGLVASAWLLLPLARYGGSIGRVTRSLVILALALSPLALAAGWWHINHHTVFTVGAIGAGWSPLVMIIVVQTLPLGLYMIERRRNSNADMLLAADSTLSFGHRVRRSEFANAGRAMPLTALFLVGATALLVELNAALALSRIGNQHFAVQVYDGVAQAGDWAFSALLLVLLTLGGGALAIGAWSGRQSTPAHPVASEDWTENLR